METLPDLTGLHPLAIVGFGIALAVIFAVRHFGMVSGQRVSPESSPAAAQVAAVIVDPAALNRLSATGEAMNMTMIEMCKILRDKVQADVSIARELDEMREEMRIQREVARRG